MTAEVTPSVIRNFMKNHFLSSEGHNDAGQLSTKVTNDTVEQYLRLSSLQIDDARLLLQNSALKLFLLPINR